MNTRVKGDLPARGLVSGADTTIVTIPETPDHGSPSGGFGDSPIGDAAKLLANLVRRGVELRVQGDRLRYRPKTAVTPELMSDLEAHKLELLALLSAKEGDGASSSKVLDANLAGSAHGSEPPTGGLVYPESEITVDDARHKGWVDIEDTRPGWASVRYWQHLQNCSSGRWVWVGAGTPTVNPEHSEPESSEQRVET
jgi:hypothetical protein